MSDARLSKDFTMQLRPNIPGLISVRADGGDLTSTAALLAQINTAFIEFKEGARSELSGIKAQLHELEQRGHSVGVMPMATASLANVLVKDDSWGAVASRKQSKTSITVKASQLLRVEANSITYDGGGFNVSEKQPGIVTGMRRKRWLRELLVTVPTSGGAVEYSRELAFTNNAAPQGGGSPFQHESVQKAESSVTYEQVDKKVATVAHFIKASKQILSDVPQLQNTLDSFLRYGLELKLEQQIISGSGLGANMSGLTTAGNYTAFTPTSGDTAIDSINRALGTLAVNAADPYVVVMHPLDFRAMQRLKASDNEYLFGSPAGLNAEKVWGTNIYLTPTLTQGKFIVMDTAQMGVLFMREDANVQLGYVNDDFTSNLVTLLAEFRATIAVQRPAAVIYGSLTT
jgi:HK97 family phage major capsid protein